MQEAGTNTVQSFLQKSPGPPLTSLPSSQASAPSTLALPHTGRLIVQSFSQPSPASWLPSSHSSTSSTMPLPHTASTVTMLQSALHSSPSSVLPSSHSSPVSTTPLPHSAVTTQPGSQPSPGS